MISSCVDWLSVTFSSQNKAAEFIIGIKDYGTYEETNARYGYDTAVKYECGLVAMWSQTRDDMGCHCILSGSTLEALAVSGNTSRELLKSAFAHNAKITRLDLAIDAIGEHISIQGIYDNALKTGHKGAARALSLITGNDGGITMYIGSRSSDKYARIYDKGKQLKNDANWKRLECELKGDVAKEFGRYVAMNDDKSIASFAWSIAQGMFYVDNDGYPLFGQQSDLVSMPKIEKQTDVEKWLATQIIPIIEKYVRNNPDSTIYDDLINALIRAKQEKQHDKIDKAIIDKLQKPQA